MANLKDKFKDNYIVKAWLVLLISLIFSSALAAVEIALKPKIVANKLNETISLVPDLIGENENSKDLTIKFKKIEIEKNNNRKAFYSVIRASKNGEIKGWVVKSKGAGYADKIELLIGLDPEVKEITGLSIIDQKETPGLGNKIVEKKFREQFLKTGTDTSLVVVKTGKKNPGEIDGITGATISSRSVCNIINTAVNDLRDTLKKSAEEKE